MADFAVTSFATGSTGNLAVAGLTFLPKYLRFTISGRSGTTETLVQFSTGFTDGSNQTAHSIFQDSTGSRTKAYTNRCINHFQRVSGTITEKIVGTFVSFDNNGGGDYGFTVNLSAADANYSVLVEAYA